MFETNEKDTVEAEDPEFGKRVQKALDLIPDVPTDYGRQIWLVDEIERISGKRFSPWGVSKWVRGISRPRHKNLELLARALRVDPGWLAAGVRQVERAPKVERHQALAPGALNLVVGMMQTMGATVAMPQDDKDDISFTAVVNGQAYPIFVPRTEQEEGNTLFLIPRYSRGMTFIAPIAHASGTGFDFLYLPEELVAKHSKQRSRFRELIVKTNKNGYTVGNATITPIKSLRDIDNKG